VRRASLILFMIDGRAGVTGDDVHFARWLRKVARADGGRRRR
jgi:predicted GTPase